MKTILKMRGPVVTHRVVQDNSTMRHLSAPQFVRAAEQLEKLKLGTVHTLPGARGPASRVFVKKPPDDNVKALLLSYNLLEPKNYEDRYSLPMSKGVSQTQRKKLVELGIYVVE